ncbi:MAG TPA: hypothetical protein VH413_17830 [Verrucomicrobiae bacterium]|jgi:hypothetical protein|nr:hypothetical protein [Verrucomicrobiae bacterium]
MKFDQRWEDLIMCPAEKSDIAFHRYDNYILPTVREIVKFFGRKSHRRIQRNGRDLRFPECRMRIDGDRQISGYKGKNYPKALTFAFRIFANCESQIKKPFAIGGFQCIVPPQIDNSCISRLGKSSVESVFSDDLKPDGRERSGKKQSV